MNEKDLRKEFNEIRQSLSDISNRINKIYIENDIYENKLKKQITLDLINILKERTQNNKERALEILNNTKKRNEYYILHKSSTTKFLENYFDK